MPADATWPPGLPTRALVSTRWTPRRDRIVTPMDYGPAKARRRGQGGIRPVPYAMYLEGDALLTTFRNFYQTTLAGGTKTFNGLADPATGSLTVIWFFADEPEAVLEEPPALWRLSMPLVEVTD